MRTKDLLFVTYQDRQSEDGLAYAIGLAKTLGKGLSILMVRERRSLSDGFTDAMAAAAFAEMGEHDTARAMLGAGRTEAELKNKVERLAEKCLSSGVAVNVRSSELDAASAIKGTMGRDDGIEMILLGPNVTENENFTAKRLARLIKSATMPIVAIARQACAA